MSRARDLADSADKDIAGTLTLDGLSVSGDVAVNTDTLFVDASADKVGIGTSSPDRNLDVVGTTGIAHQYPGASDELVLTQYNTTGDVALNNKANASVYFGTNNTERMRIDSSGNLLVGTTQHPSVITGTSTETGLGYATGSYLSIARSSGPILHLNRLSTDGEIATFRKDGSTVGSIATNSTSNFYIGSGQTDHVGLEFGSPNIMPMKNNALADNAVDLGLSTQRFKDLYLSGGVYLGGTGSANYLDDYEEGTWTPTVAPEESTGVISSHDCKYVRVGNICHVIVAFTIGTNFSSPQIDGLPFTVDTVGLGTSWGYTGILITNASGATGYQIGMSADDDSTRVRFFRNGNTNTLHNPSTSDEVLRGHLTYRIYNG
jgi:hypothetical protein